MDLTGYGTREICETLGNEAGVTGQFGEVVRELNAVVRFVEYLSRKVENMADEHDRRARQWAWAAFMEHGVTFDELQERTGWDPVRLEAALEAPIEQGHLDLRMSPEL